MKNPDPSIIKFGNAADACLAYTAMFRYAFGRTTYMPGVVIDTIKLNAQRLTDGTLWQLDRELTEEAKRYERVYKDKPTSNYGMECDRQQWLAFHAWVRAELAKRKGGAK